VADLFPASQSLQSQFEFVSSCPAGQSSHGACPALDISPSTQAAQSSPEMDDSPAPQFEQVVKGDEDTVPALHAIQDEAWSAEY